MRFITKTNVLLTACSLLYAISAGSTLEYSSYLGGVNDEYGSRIAADTEGNAYLVGNTNGSDYPTQIGSFTCDKPSASGMDIVITKLNLNMGYMVYSTYLGGDGNDNAFAISLDNYGSLYITGQTYSTDFPVTYGAYKTSLSGTKDVFVTKLDSFGSYLVYSTYLGGSDSDIGYGMDIDEGGNAYITGMTYSADYPTTTNSFSTTYNMIDAFVTEINSTGTDLVYSTLLGGETTDCGTRLVLDSYNNAYVTGYTLSTAFPITPGVLGAYSYYTGGTPKQDVFVSKLNPNGTALEFSTYLGGANDDYAQGLALDTEGNIYVGGYTYSNDFPTTPGAYRMYSYGNSDNFVSKINSVGSMLIYSTFIGGSDAETLTGLAVDSEGKAYISGYTLSQDYPVTFEAFSFINYGSSEGFLSKINADGSDLWYSTYIGGSQIDSCQDIALDDLGNAYIIGSTNSNDFPIQGSAYSFYNNGLYDIFVVKMGISSMVPVELSSFMSIE